jgi:hypothetical protein
MRKYNDLFKDLEPGALFVIKDYKTVFMKMTEIQQLEPSGMVKKNTIMLKGTKYPGNLKRFDDFQKCWEITSAKLSGPCLRP